MEAAKKKRINISFKQKLLHVIKKTNNYSIFILLIASQAKKKLVQ